MLSRGARRVVLAVAIVVFLAIAIVCWQTGAITPTSVGDWLDSLGPWAPLVFLAAFVGGSLIGLPGMAFVVGARLAFGPWLGFALGYAGGLGAVMAPFAVSRLYRRDRPPWQPKHRWLRRAMEQIETRPVRAVIALRLILWFNQPLSYALGLAPVRTVDYLRGCAIALLPVVAAGNLATSLFV